MCETPWKTLERQLMKLRTRGLVVAVAIATAAGAFVAAPSQAASAARTVTIWSGANDAKSDNQSPIIAAWAKSQGITINTVYKKNVRDEFIKAVPDGKGPDLMVGAHDWTGQLVGAGVVAPVALGSLSSKFSAATRSGFTVSGKLYGMPIFSENIALIWNKRDGEDPAGKSFMDLVNSKNGLAITRDLTSGDPYHWSSIASSYGLTLFNRDKSGWTTTLGYGGAGSDAYANFLAGDAKKIIRPADGWDQSACTLQKGAYIISGPWMYNHGQDTISGCSAKPLKASEMGIAPIPSLGGKKVSQFSGVYGYWMSSKVSGQPNAVSVGKVLRYVGSSEFQLALNKAGNNIPVNQDALRLMTDKNLAAFGQAGVNALPMPSYVFMDTVWSKIGSAEAAILAGKYTGTPGDFLRKAVAAAQAAIDTK